MALLGPQCKLGCPSRAWSLTHSKSSQPTFGDILGTVRNNEKIPAFVVCNRGEAANVSVIRNHACQQTPHQ